MLREIFETNEVICRFKVFLLVLLHIFIGRFFKMFPLLWFLRKPNSFQVLFRGWGGKPWCDLKFKKRNVKCAENLDSVAVHTAAAAYTSTLVL